MEFSLQAILSLVTFLHSLPIFLGCISLFAIIVPLYIESWFMALLTSKELSCQEDHLDFETEKYVVSYQGRVQPPLLIVLLLIF